MELAKIKQALEKLMTLDIRTIVGESVIDPHSGKLMPAAGAKMLASQINLVDGDITTAFTEDFLTPPLSDIRDFHRLREQQGHELIQGNIRALQEMVKLIADLSAQESAPENERTPTPSIV